MIKSDENILEFLTSQQFITVTASARWLRSKMDYLERKFPEHCICLHRNSDGSALYRVPVSWLRISAPRSIDWTDAKRMEFSARMRKPKE